MKTHAAIIVSFSVLFLSFSCKNDRAGEKPGENPYQNGYGRLPNSVRLATYNVCHCTPQGSAVADYDLTASAISAIAPDVIALQELDSINRRNPHFQLEELARRTGMIYTYGYTICFQDGKYGNGILSRETPLVVENIEYSLLEPRKFLVAEFKDYIFIATHLDHTDEEYRISCARQINFFVETRYGGCGKPVFLTGDMNDPDLNSKTYKVLLDKWDIISIKGRGTYIGNGANDAVDYILLWKTCRAKVAIIGTAIPEFDGIDLYEVSDHLPVMVDIRDNLSSTCL